MHPFETRFDEAWPTSDWYDSHVLLGVSGGPDSVAMLRAAAALKERCGGSGRLHVAHLNHALRGSEADADASWLEGLCTRLQIPIDVDKVDVAAIAAQQGDGWEAAARGARYVFLQRTADRLGARFVAVAHTADDQVETVLHHILRGTGLAGLAGMRRVRPLSRSVALVRPLLDMRRNDVLEYFAAIGQDFRTDASNADPRWTRNRVRAELLPLLREHYNADVDAALLRLATQARDSQQLVAERAADIACGCVAVEFAGQLIDEGDRLAACVRIDCRRLTGLLPLIIGEVCKIAWTESNWPQQAMGFEQWQQLADLAGEDSPSPAINLPGNIRARREKHFLILEWLGLP